MMKTTIIKNIGCGLLLLGTTACADVVAVGLDFNQCAALPEIFNKYFAAFFGCKSGIFSEPLS